jgi:hypothetical protein
MKLPNSRRSAMREVDRVVAKVLKSADPELWEEDQKKYFEQLLDRVIIQVARNRRMDVNQVAIATDQVVEAIPAEYGQLAEDLKGWETLIAFIYLKYQQVLGVDTSMFE